MESKLIIIILFAFMLSGCGTAYGKTDTKIEVSSYSENTIKLNGRYSLDISCDIGNIGIYTWKRDEIKIEITRRVKGTYKREMLMEKLENFDIELITDNDTVFLKSRYKGRKKDLYDAIVDYTIYMPKTIEHMNYKVSEGKVRIYDDIQGVLKAELDNTDIQINRFNGVLNIFGEEGDVKISNGKIKGNSEVSKKAGNIFIKAEFDQNGEYMISTGFGHIELLAEAGSKINFETVGELTINEFEQNGFITSNGINQLKMQGYNLSNEDKVPKVKLKSELGKISIRKY
ncbi:MAG: hypothetical protein GX270_13065 [Clostridiaceae bacterium]|jgi:hypothetical protein|nr:hypothetical protein [Clostridiaceae bacterium]